jgi:hypothetical protein
MIVEGVASTVAQETQANPGPYSVEKFAWWLQAFLEAVRIIVHGSHCEYIIGVADASSWGVKVTMSDYVRRVEKGITPLPDLSTVNTPRLLGLTHVRPHRNALGRPRRRQVGRVLGHCGKAFLKYLADLASKDGSWLRASTIVTECGECMTRLGSQFDDLDVWHRQFVATVRSAVYTILTPSAAAGPAILPSATSGSITILTPGERNVSHVTTSPLAFLAAALSAADLWPWPWDLALSTAGRVPQRAAAEEPEEPPQLQPPQLQPPPRRSVVAYWSSHFDSLDLVRQYQELAAGGYRRGWGGVGAEELGVADANEAVPEFGVADEEPQRRFRWQDWSIADFEGRYRAIWDMMLLPQPPRQGIMPDR